MAEIIDLRHGPCHMEFGKSRLTNEGVYHASVLCDRYRNQKIEAVFSAPHWPAKGTARIIAKPHALEVREHPTLKRSYRDFVSFAQLLFSNTSGLVLVVT